MPERIQLLRIKGWRLHEISPNAIVVSRPSKWGNPFRIVSVNRNHWTVIDDNGVDYREPPTGWTERRTAELKAVRLFYTDIKGELAPYPPLSELRGHDLACWCPLNQPCHADILLELANG